MTPFGGPKWHQNGPKIDQKSRAKFKSEKVASQERLGAVFVRFPCVIILQNRAPAKGKHTFLKIHFFHVQLRQVAVLDRFSLPKWLQKAPFLASETVQKQYVFLLHFWMRFRPPSPNRTNPAQNNLDPLKGPLLCIYPNKGLVLLDFPLVALIPWEVPTLIGVLDPLGDDVRFCFRFFDFLNFYWPNLAFWTHTGAALKGTH